MKALKQFVLGLTLSMPLLFAVSAASANEAGYPLDQFPQSKLTDNAALQNGAKLFVNYCLNCHSASSMRYNRLQDLGLTEDQIRNNLMFTAEKIGDPMRTSLRPADAKEWFGALPPDLSVISRARASGAGSGSDWLYTYLRAYYRDSSRTTGWNNAVFPNVGMPHVLWEMQGARGATQVDVKEIKDAKGVATGKFNRTTVSFASDGARTEKTEEIKDGHPHASSELTLGKAEGGKFDQASYDSQIADLVAYLTYMSDPSAKERSRLGVWVILFLLLFTFLAWNLNRSYWKDIK
jgi:ubiquinol-cytochrome c reductase cytochrome c1 subunit